jgi:hypothetical protein
MKTRYHAKLTEDQKRKIIEYLNDGRIKQEWIAKQFGVKQCTISYHNRKLKRAKA